MSKSPKAPPASHRPVQLPKTSVTTPEDSDSAPARADRRAVPRLKLRTRKGRESVFVIHHGSVQLSTRTADPGAATAIFKRYLDNLSSTFGSAAVDDPYLSDVIELVQMSEADGRKQSADSTIKRHSLTDRRLLEFWGLMKLSEVSPASCDRYVAWRRKTKRKKALSGSTLRLELKRLKTMITAFCNRRKLTCRPIVKIPPRGVPKRLYASPRDIARLIRALRAWKRRAQNGEAAQFNVEEQVAHIEAVIRFVFIGLYTGTRLSALLKTTWRHSKSNGFIDVRTGRYYRKGTTEQDKNKRRPIARLCTPQESPHFPGTRFARGFDGLGRRPR